MHRRIVFIAALGAAAVWAQQNPQQISKTGKPPVVFVNGYQDPCPTTFESTFGIADQILQSNGISSTFFNNCDYAQSGKPSLEALGQKLGDFIGSLKYSDGTPVDQVDIVAHSMGGLIVRAYLSGMTANAGTGTFAPPQNTRVRKAVFLGTPHWGTPVAQLQALTGGNPQTDEMTPGSNFLWALNTWNDNTDDLHGVDAVAVVGTAGLAPSGIVAAFLPAPVGPYDGVVPQTSATLDFYMPGRSRLIPYCHVEAGGLVSQFGLCPNNAPGIARMHDANHPSAKIMVSFLNGTSDWQTIGDPPQSNALLAANGAAYVRPFDPNDAPVSLQSADIKGQSLTKANDQIAYTMFVPAGPGTATANSSAGTLTATVNVPASTGQAFSLKSGPNISRAIPAAAQALPLAVAPRMIIAIYGDHLASTVQQAQALPLTTTLSDAQAKLNDTALSLYYAGPGQVNAVLPGNAAGFAKLTVQNPSGASTVNLLFETAHPAVFTADSSGAGLASAINVRTGTPVTASNPLHAGEFVSLYLTGLGQTTRGQFDLDWANATPTVTVGGAPCTVTFAGANPVYPGLDQINCQLATNVAANPSAQVLVASAGRTSNATTLPIQ